MAHSLVSVFHLSGLIRTLNGESERFHLSYVKIPVSTFVQILSFTGSVV